MKRILLVIFIVSSLRQISGSALFDPSKQICCSGKVFDGAANLQFTKCCGNVTIDTTKNTCCLNPEVGIPTVHPYKYGLQTMCCGSEIYDVKKSVCCMNTIFELPSESDVLLVSCCEDLGPFNTKTHLCCGGKIIEKQSKTSECCEGLGIYDSEKEICCPGADVILPKTKDSIRCCGNSTYDSKNQVCCPSQKIIQSKLPNQFCCDEREAYDPVTEVCCSGKVFPKTSSSEGCCGNKVIDFMRQTCPLPQRPFGGRSNQFQIGIMAAPLRVEGSKRINYFPQQRMAAKCGKERIDHMTQICCLDEKTSEAFLYNKQSHFSTCCGKFMMDLERDSDKMCCNGQVIGRSSNMEQCCYNMTYDASRQICCNSLINGVMHGPKTYDRMAGRFMACCGAQQYDTQSELCCLDLKAPSDNFKVLKKNGPNMQCCGGTSYDVTTHVCCDGEVFPLESGDSQNPKFCCASYSVFPGGDSFSNQNRHQLYYVPGAMQGIMMGNGGMATPAFGSPSHNGMAMMSKRSVANDDFSQGKLS